MTLTVWKAKLSVEESRQLNEAALLNMRYDLDKYWRLLKRLYLAQLETPQPHQHAYWEERKQRHLDQPQTPGALQ